MGKIPAPRPLRLDGSRQQLAEPAPQWPAGERQAAILAEPPRKKTLSNLHTIRQQAGLVAIPRLELVVESAANQPVDQSQVYEGDLVRLGSHESNDVALADQHVSRFHCTLGRSETGWSITDNGSLNGTFVDGVRVRDADLPLPACRIRLGGSVVRVQQLTPTNVAELPDRSSFGALHGSSIAMRRLFSELERVAASDATVLIEGESGTGKELAASEIATRSPRAGEPFVIVDCSSISPTLIESELFGHAKGAFTGADRERVGAFEDANRGTIFLDEIGELPLEMQPKLLRALENLEIRRAGENRVRRIDVRVIAATNRRLEAEVNAGRFREDLFFRLSVVTIRIPPLRKRVEDIPGLIGVLLGSLNAEDGMSLFTPAVLADLERHPWRGNVRELRNYVERTVVLERADPATGRASQLPAPATGSEPAPPPAAETGELDLPFKVAKEQVISEFERRYLSNLLESAGGNISKAARQAKMDRMYLYRLLQKYELRGPSIKD